MPPEIEAVCGSGTPAGSLSDVVERVVAEVLETMFFAEAVPTQCRHDWMGSAVTARVCFEGSHWGEMRLSTSLEAVESIACAFLGADPAEASDTARVEVLLELANILCGAILSHLWPESKLALGAPELLAEAGDFPGCRLHRCFELPEGSLSVCIRWSEGAEIS